MPIGPKSSKHTIGVVSSVQRSSSCQLLSMYEKVYWSPEELGATARCLVAPPCSLLLQDSTWLWLHSAISPRAELKVFSHLQGFQTTEPRGQQVPEQEWGFSEAVISQEALGSVPFDCQALRLWFISSLLLCPHLCPLPWLVLCQGLFSRVGEESNFPSTLLGSCWGAFVIKDRLTGEKQTEV